MIKGFSEMKRNRAEKEFIEMYSIFKKFINNDPDIKLLFGEPFNFANVDKIHQETAKEYDSLEKTRIDAYDRIMEINKKLELIDFFLQRKALIIGLKNFNELKKEYYGLLRVYKNGDYIDLFDYYFKYNNRYYTLDMSSDIEDFGYIIDNPDNNLVCCELREFNEYIECTDTKKEITFIYDKEKNKVTDILNISRYRKKDTDDTTIEKYTDLDTDSVFKM